MQEAIRRFQEAPSVIRLTGVSQHYEWGGYEFIPRLLGVSNPHQQPFAELWMGAHPNAPSIAHLDGLDIGLDQLVGASPEAVLGSVSRWGGHLPYLFKVLDARKMLSIQAHPNKQQAEEGFERENMAGIPLTASNRNYKDNNHKPEVHVVLTEFWMLHGFRPMEEIAETLRSVPEMRSLMPDLDARLHRMGPDLAERSSLLKRLYQDIMEMPQDHVNAILRPLIARLQVKPSPPKNSPDFWALRSAAEFPLPNGNLDRGIFSIYLLNLLHLLPGQGTYQPAGTLHAYLEGVNMELMANSDNVLRGGLTPKNVDVVELIHTLVFEDGKPKILQGEALSQFEQVYHTPATEFQLSRIHLPAGATIPLYPTDGPDLLITMDGCAAIRSRTGQVELDRGQIALAPASVPYSIESTESATLFRAAIPEL